MIIIKGFVFILGLLAVLILLVLIKQLIKLRAGNKRVRQELAATKYDPLPDIGIVDSLTVLPLVDFYTDDPKLKTEAGVSYLVKADDTTILMDVGFNKKKEHPSPLLHNMDALNISPHDLDAIFISHIHLDHIGGMSEQRKGVFSLSQGQTRLPEIPVYAPDSIAPSDFTPDPLPVIVNNPQGLKKGVASTGVIPRNLFLAGYTREHCLAVKLAGKGIVLIIGCGHPTIERIIERAQMIFEEPIYGIIGGLHFPVQGGRIMVGPINLQSLVGCDRPPWKGINEQDVQLAIDAMKKVNPQFVSLSPHDSSDWSIQQFKNAFGDAYHDLKVGTPLVV
jgi:7,8-dihydropterin-6-yl-methyl-4-(beta-D-ribofuranosyl)aminobenzene 5'-phosphate synthase